MKAQLEASLLAVDSPELYETFFRFQDDLGRWAGQRKAAVGPSAAQSLDDAIARHFTVSPGDMAKLAVVTESVMKDLRAIDADMWSYRNARAKYEQLPETAVMERFAQRRQAAVQGGKTQLQKTLGAGSYASLRSYVNNIHRARYRPVLPKQSAER